MIYIIGHTKPDLDSAVAPISLKYLLDRVDFFERKNTKPVLAGEANNETKFVFDKFNIPLPEILKAEQIKPDDKFILVDHNEESQRLPGIKNEQITDIFDHHKALLNIPGPIYIRTEPLGATNTLIYEVMKFHGVKPDKSLVPLMLCAILSDTVGLKSVTTTKRDKKSVEELANIPNTPNMPNIDTLTLEIFKAKSNISGLSSKQILTKDYKLYDFAGKKVLINQVETVEQEELIIKSEELIKVIQQLKKEMKLDHAFCLISDVLKMNSKCFVIPEDEQILNKAFNQAKKIKNGVYDLGPVMSRKKEVAPAIEKAIK